MFFYNIDKDVIDNYYDAFAHHDIFYFYYFDKEFSSINWTIDSEKSLSDLYRQRAEQIRNDYEYVIIPYSGGYKSSLILETFYYNNIHIDEVLLVGAFSQDSYTGSDENHNGEIYNQAIPTLNKLNLKNTKITQVDYSIYFNNPNNFSLIKRYGSDWIKHIGAYYSPHNLFWHDLKKFIGQNNDKKTGVIFGTNSPLLKIEDQKAYTYFPSDNFYNFGNFQKDQNFTRVNFFTDKDTTYIIKNQLHKILNFNRSCLFYKRPTPIEIYNELVFELKNPINFKSKKSPTNLISLRDSFLLNKKDSDIYKIYKQSTIDKKLFIFVRNSINNFSVTGSLKTKKYYLIGENFNE